MAEPRLHQRRQYENLSLSSTAADLLRGLSKQFSVEKGRHVTLSETVEILAELPNCQGEAYPVLKPFPDPLWNDSEGDE